MRRAITWASGSAATVSAPADAECNSRYTATPQRLGPGLMRASFADNMGVGHQWNGKPG
jgi:hypothetical protein